MKNLKLLLVFALFSNIIFSQNYSIGKEKILPLEFPKYSLSSFYNGLRYASINKYSTKLGNNYGLGIFFDVGLYPNLSAGAEISVAGNLSNSLEPMNYRLEIFARPKITFFERLSLFARLTGGLSVLMLNSPLEIFKKSLPVAKN